MTLEPVEHVVLVDVLLARQSFQRIHQFGAHLDLLPFPAEVDDALEACLLNCLVRNLDALALDLEDDVVALHAEKNAMP